MCAGNKSNAYGYVKNKWPNNSCWGLNHNNVCTDFWGNSNKATALRGELINVLFYTATNK